MNVRQMLSNIRTRCGDPRPQQPGDRTLLLLLSTQIQTYLNKVNLTGRPWAVDELSLVVSGGQEDYQLPIDSHFGKPILCRTVYTLNPGFIERDVDFSELGEFNFDWEYPKDFGSTFVLDGSPNNAMRLAFFRKSGQDAVWVRVVPIPAASAEYQILYQVGVYGESVPLDETPVLPEHHALIEIWTALAVLPHCKWGDDSKVNDTMQAKLFATLDQERQRLEVVFNRYISTTSASVRPSYRELPFSID